MNFLAHALLSFSDENLLIGNFIADDVKGKKYLDFPEPIQHGILLHRFIDSFTDTHVLVRQSKNHFRSQFDKFSGPLVDIFFDHLLAIFWEKYTPMSLRDFTYNSYKVLRRNFDLLPADSQYFLGYAIKYDILFAYKEKTAIEKVLVGMTHRYRAPYALVEAYPTFEAHRLEMEHDFQAFMPEIMLQCQTFLDNLRRQ